MSSTNVDKHAFAEDYVLHVDIWVNPPVQRKSYNMILPTVTSVRTTAGRVAITIQESNHESPRHWELRNKAYIHTPTSSLQLVYREYLLEWCR